MSALLPDLFPKGRSVMMTSTLLSRRQGRRQSHWRKSAGARALRLFFVTRSLGFNNLMFSREN